MDEFIKKIINNKNELKSLYLPCRSAVVKQDISVFPKSFVQYGGKSFLPYSYYVIMSYDVNVVLWSKEGWAIGAQNYGYSNTIYPLKNKNFDAISFSFGGCSMARFTIGNNNHYIAHIQSSTNRNDDCRDAWIDFVNTNPAITINAMFRPDCEATYLNQNQNMQLWGVITKEMNCYSVYVLCYDSKNKETVPEDPDCVTIKLQAIVQHTSKKRTLIGLFLKNQGQALRSKNDFKNRKSVWNLFFKGMTKEIWKR